MKISNLVTLLAVAGQHVLCMTFTVATTISTFTEDSLGNTVALNTTIVPRDTASPSPTIAIVDPYTVTSLTPEKSDAVVSGLHEYIESLESSPEFSSIANRLHTEQLDETAIANLIAQGTQTGISAHDAVLSSLVELYPTYAQSLIENLAHAEMSILSVVVNAPTTSDVPSSTDDVGADATATSINQMTTTSAASKKTPSKAQSSSKAHSTKTKNPKKHGSITSRAVLPRKTQKSIVNPYTVTSLSPKQISEIEPLLPDSENYGDYQSILNRIATDDTWPSFVPMPASVDLTAIPPIPTSYSAEWNSWIASLPSYAGPLASHIAFAKISIISSILNEPTKSKKDRRQVLTVLIQNRTSTFGDFSDASTLIISGQTGRQHISETPSTLAADESSATANSTETSASVVQNQVTSTEDAAATSSSSKKNSASNKGVVNSAAIVMSWIGCMLLL